MKKILLLFITTIILSSAFSQELTKNGTPEDERFGFSVGYFGDRLTNHGYLLVLENYLATTHNFNVVGSIKFSNFFAPQNFTAVTLMPKIGLRYTSNFGLSLESHLGFGYIHRFYNFTEYDVNSQGQLVSNGKVSQGSATPSISLGLGYDFRRKTDLPLLYFFRASVNYNYPTRHFIFEASYGIETGFTYIPKFNMKQRKPVIDN